MDEELKERMERRQARMDQLYQKPVGELVRMIVELEEENARVKEYRSTLIRIKSLLTPPDERRRKGRPSKDEELI